MLYKFKSKATGDLIMLEPNGRQILRIIGKDDTDSLARGIVLPADMPAAIAAIEAAISREEALYKQRTQESLDRDETPAPPEGISLRQRGTPFIDMLKRCYKEEKELVWGV